MTNEESICLSEEKSCCCVLKKAKVKKLAHVTDLCVNCGELEVTESRDDPSSDRDRTSCHGNPGS